MAEPTPTITGCILARNEERQIEDALRSLRNWVNQIVVIDNGSTDRTVAIAEKYGATILHAPPALNYDSSRNLVLDVAIGDWIFFLDADERVPPRLAEELERLLRTIGNEFEALCIPFKHYFCGKWMEHSGWYPGYTRPQLLKKGCFRYNERLHSGVEVNGRIVYFPAKDPDLAIVHYSYSDLHEYVEKLNRYTDGEALNLLADGHSHSWQSQLAHFVHDWQQYYERGRADLDGMHGFVLSFCSAFYRFASRAKLWDLLRQRGETDPGEAVPSNLREMLTHMARVAQEGAERWITPEKPAKVESRVRLTWKSPLFDASGYADSARNLVAGLMRAGEPMVLVPYSWPGDAGLSQEESEFFQAITMPRDIPAELCVNYTLLTLQEPNPLAQFNIARTMFETDGLPVGAAARLNAMDRIWVPSEFNKETFAANGVDPAKIVVVPESIDPAPYLAEVEPWPVPGDEPFKFLSVFDWSLHKGWDVLMEAFVREFGTNPNVGLILKVWSSNGLPVEGIRHQADAHLRARFGKGLEDVPNIHLWIERIPAKAMPALYRAVDTFVLATRGEVWCRPLMEAMAAGLPTIVTAWSGLTAFHNEEVGFPVRCSIIPVSVAGAREIPLYHGHNWAEPDIEDLGKRMRQVVRQPKVARKKGLIAQQRVASDYSHTAVTTIIQAELTRCRDLARAKPKAPMPAQQATVVSQPMAPSRQPPILPPANRVTVDPVDDVDFVTLLGRPLRVRWEGPQMVLSSIALVNREMCLQLADRPDIELSIAEVDHRWRTLKPDGRLAPLGAAEGRELSGPPDVTIRHHFPPNWQRPHEGKLIVMQPWEYGALPRDWMPGALMNTDEIWAYSRFVRDIYVRSGVPAEKVSVVPLGVRPDVFKPKGSRYKLATKKTTRFLFVGGAIDRKGADILLNAYLGAFNRNDDVCLVVKDMGTRSFYGGQTMTDAFRRVQADPTAPEVLYLDDDLSDEQMASIYRSCTCVVLPYRGEGFGLSPLEGMACGLPAIVTAGGPTDDYLDDSMALRLPYHTRVAPNNQVGPFECVGNPWQLDPDPNALAHALRWVCDNPIASRERGKLGREHVQAGWTWERTAVQLRCRLYRHFAPKPQAVDTKAVLWRNPHKCTRTAPAKGKAIQATDRKRKIEISLCVIARDEEPRIAQCLESAAPYVDEIVVVDTGSTDRTREIAQDCGAKVYNRPWTDSFSEARNAGIDKAKGDWIFWMDADDVLPAECGPQLSALVQQTPNKDAAYHVQVHIPPGPEEFTSAVVDHVKLFPRRSDLRFEFRIHEQIVPALRRIGLKVRFSDAYVVHQHYDRSPEGQKKKRMRDFRLLDLDLTERPDHPFILFNCGMTYLYATKEYEVAAHYLQRSLAASDWRDSIVRKAYALLTTARICQMDWSAALAANEKGRLHYPDDAELLFQAGQIYQRFGRMAEARTALETLITGSDSPHYRSVDSGLRTYRGRHELALLYHALGATSACLEVLREICSEYPHYKPAHDDLVNIPLGIVKYGPNVIGAHLRTDGETPPGVEITLSKPLKQRAFRDKASH